MALFACSFDAASPLAPWTVASGVAVVTGRNGNGCSIPNASAFLSVSGAFGASCTGGLAYKPNQFSNNICSLADSGGGIGAPHAELNQGSDGRIYITIGASLLGSTVGGPFDGLVQNVGIWRYFELSVDIVKTVTPVDATHSNLTIQVTATLHVNNELIDSVTDGWAAANLLNSDLPTGTISSFAIQQNFSIVDDCYVDTVRIGDCHVMSDDTTVTVETSAPDVTQTLFEVGIIDPAAAPDITQSPIEVGLAPITITIACPVLNLATLGTAYSSFVIVTGGTGPFTFAIISGALPPGSVLNTVTGEIHGIPTTVGFYTYTVQVTDSLAQVTSIECTIQVSAVQPPVAKAPTRCPLNIGEEDPITLSCPVLGSPAVVGIPYSKQMIVSGGTPPFTFTFILTVGPLPPGLVLDILTGIISGTPTTQGLYPYAVQVIDSNGLSAIATCSITIVNNVTLSVTCPLSGAANVGESYSGTLIGSGGTGPYTFSIVAGTLPTGLTLTGDTISGIPTESGTFDYTVRVTDSLAATADSPCEIIVGPPLPPPPPPLP